ncbi:hypothetical protein GDO86_008618 [Hymenochirus boettgeri]|uniref:Uncharacterized protein n=1 Tax=Hymenochirus boettgeri TaxID=247094 RepID=A0A8T2J3P5_9PIPI|nr:hypothetical protein GDO86_008618 [Hymenochirus boettgeri]
MHSAARPPSLSHTFCSPSPLTQIPLWYSRTSSPSLNRYNSFVRNSPKLYLPYLSPLAFSIAGSRVLDWLPLSQSRTWLLVEGWDSTPEEREADTLCTTEESPGSEDESDCNEAIQPDLPAKFNKLWRDANENPYNFNGWTKILEFVDAENNLEAGRKVYNAFLSRFPYCYGYWKKYADLEHQFHYAAETEEVYNRALQSIPVSLDLWIAYITYLNNNLDMSLPKSVEKLRGTFKSAAEAAGMEFRSDKFWDMYAEWEIAQGNLKGATAVYDLVLNVPTQLYRQHHERFQHHVASHPPQQIIGEEEYQWLRTKVIEGDNTQTAAEDSASEDDQENSDHTDPDLQSKIKDQFLMIRDQLFISNESEVRKRWTFEEAIIRPYFHATPLDHAQLENWRKYLEFEISQGDHQRIVTLFERCLVACALYEEFWLAYVQYMEPHSVEATRSILQRACCIHLPLKPSLSLQWAAFEEKHGMFI